MIYELKTRTVEATGNQEIRCHKVDGKEASLNFRPHEATTLLLPFDEKGFDSHFRTFERIAKEN